ncbi:hypothetical protein AMJ80_12120 [bacterium SM23_31]|nr:MAG: hypothetical protein AMJ80_12120 [bacterium SM23_31]
MIPDICLVADIGISSVTTKKSLSKNEITKKCNFIVLEYYFLLTLKDKYMLEAQVLRRFL